MGRGTGRFQVSRRTDQVTGVGALLYVVAWIIYGGLAMYGFIEAPSAQIDGWLFITSALLWLLMALFLYRHPTAAPRYVLAGFAWFHLLSLVYVLWVVGFTASSTYLWVLLLVASGVYFRLVGLALSSMTLLVMAVIAGQPDSWSATATTYLTIVFISTLIVYGIQQVQRDQHELDESNQQASLQRDRTTTLINNLTDAVLSTDQNGIITLYNAAALNLLDTNAGLDGLDIDEVLQLRDIDGKAVSLADQLYDATAATVRDDLVTLISGETTRLEIAFSPIRSGYDEDTDLADSDDDKIGGFIIIIRDVTSAKGLEEERDEFISVVSHELRTPVTIVEGTISNAQVMLRQKDVSQHKIAESIDMAHDQILFLARMINDLSTLSRAERGVADEAEDIDVNELTQSVFREHQDEAAAKNLKFDIQIPAKIGYVRASRLYLKELLQNFVTNAIKYTRSGSISIEVKTTEGQVEFAVVDTGIGISQSDQKRIFDKFYRAEDYRTRESSGTGLGLYVAAKLARKLDTTIDIRSRLNHGSRFSFQLPLIDDKKPRDTT